MNISNNWTDYECIATGDGEKLERWGNVILNRPDPQIIWNKTNNPVWNTWDGYYERSKTGGGSWHFKHKLKDYWTIKYKEIFNMSIYALTLSIVLYLIYICVNITTGFTIKYFDLAYEIISYIYIITAILMIKSDLIKQQIEIGKIVEEQKKVREEKKQEDNEEEKPKEDKEEKKEKKDKEEKEPEHPEGSQA